MNQVINFLLIFISFTSLSFASVAITFQANTLSTNGTTVQVNVAGKLVTNQGSTALNDGSYTVYTRDQSGTYGSFELSNGIINSVSGSLVKISDTTIGFDNSKLTHIYLDPRVLSVPQGRSEIFFPAISGQTYINPIHMNLPEGNFTIFNRGQLELSKFSITSGLINSQSDNLNITANQDLSFDLSKMNSITTKPNVLDSAGVAELVIPQLSSRSYTATTFYLPLGSYNVNMRSGDQLGTITSTIDGISISNGALIISNNSLIPDLTKLNLINIESSSLLDASNIFAQLFVPAISGGVYKYTYLYVPNGSYSFYTRLQRTYGTFNVNNGQVQIVSGFFKSNSNNGIGFDLCKLNKVNFSFSSDLKVNPVELTNLYIDSSTLKSAYFLEGSTTLNLSNSLGNASYQISLQNGQVSPQTITHNGSTLNLNVEKCILNTAPLVTIKDITSTIVNTTQYIDVDIQDAENNATEMKVIYGDGAEETKTISSNGIVNLSHIFSGTGSYNITIEVSDIFGSSTTVSKVIEVISENGITEKIRTNISNASTGLSLPFITILDNIDTYSGNFGFNVGGNGSGSYGRDFWKSGFKKKRSKKSRHRFGGGWDGDGVNGWYSASFYGANLPMDDLHRLLNPAQLRSIFSDLQLKEMFDPLILITKYDIDVLKVILPPALIRDILFNNPLVPNISNFVSWDDIKHLAKKTEKLSKKAIQKELELYRKANKAIFKEVKKGLNNVKDFANREFIDKIKAELNAIDVEKLFKDIAQKQLDVFIGQLKLVKSRLSPQGFLDTFHDAVMLAKAMSGDPKAILSTLKTSISMLNEVGLVSNSDSQNLLSAVNKAQELYVSFQFATNEMANFNKALYAIRKAGLIPTEIYSGLKNLEELYSNFDLKNLAKAPLLKLLERAENQIMNLDIPMRISVILTQKIRQIKAAVEINNYLVMPVILDLLIEELEQAIMDNPLNNQVVKDLKILNDTLKDIKLLSDSFL